MEFKISEKNKIEAEKDFIDDEVKWFVWKKKMKKQKAANEKDIIREWLAPTHTNTITHSNSHSKPRIYILSHTFTLSLIEGR